MRKMLWIIILVPLFWLTGCYEETTEMRKSVFKVPLHRGRYADIQGVACSNDGQTVYAATEYDLFKSEDGGKTWKCILTVRR